MKVVSTKNELQSEIEKIKEKKKSIGLVPTMGALHKGHLSLIERCINENDISVVSIFVNPTQFNNKKDLEKYPRNVAKDIQLLDDLGCTLVFTPSVEEMYEDKELNQPFEFDFGGLDTMMEGKFRPGHFNGVVQIVSKLFQLVQPDRAYFGEKDFQQLAIIRYMVKKMKFDIDIVPCPIVREANGLAMSSRNELLTPEQRKIAPEISKILFASRELVPELSPSAIENWVTEKLNNIPAFKVDYFEIVNAETLLPVQSWKESAIGCVAVYCGEVRLIDNIRYN